MFTRSSGSLELGHVSRYTSSAVDKVNFNGNPVVYRIERFRSGRQVVMYTRWLLFLKPLSSHCIFRVRFLFIPLSYSIFSSHPASSFYGLWSVSIKVWSLRPSRLHGHTPSLSSISACMHAPFSHFHPPLHRIWMSFLMSTEFSCLAANRSTASIALCLNLMFFHLLNRRYISYKPANCLLRDQVERVNQPPASK
jgi:hypothetical protein